METRSDDRSPQPRPGPVGPMVGLPDPESLAVNYLRQALVPPADVGHAVSVALFAATTAVVAIVVTAVHLTQQRSGPPR